MFEKWRLTPRIVTQMEHFMQYAKLWVRVGDDDNYQDLDGLQEVADYLAEMGASDPIEWYNEYGVTSPEFRGHNYISLFLGDAGAQPIRELTPDEHNEINRLLASSRSHGTALSAQY